MAMIGHTVVLEEAKKLAVYLPGHASNNDHHSHPLLQPPPTEHCMAHWSKPRRDSEHVEQHILQHHAAAFTLAIQPICPLPS